MRTAVEHGLHAAPWRRSSDPGAHVARAAKLMAWSASDAGHLCPISMTYAVVPALRATPALAGELRAAAHLVDLPTSGCGRRCPRLRAARRHVDDREAGRFGRPGQHDHCNARTGDGSYRLVGHKWFTSAPMSDVFLTLAQAPDGLSCFLVPRVLPDGTRNAFFLQRLKDKLGNKSNASSEVEYDNAVRLAGRATRDAAWQHHHRDGQHDPPGLCGDGGGGDATGPRARTAPRHAPLGVRATARSSSPRWRTCSPTSRSTAEAADDGGDADRRCAVDRAARAATSQRSPSAGSRCRSPSTGCASGWRRTPARRWSASVAMATSRSRGCPVSTGRRRWSRSGRARGNVACAGHACERWAASRRRSNRSSANSSWRAGTDSRFDDALALRAQGAGRHRRTCSSGPGASWNSWRCCCRVRCSCDTVRRRSRTRSSRRVSPWRPRDGLRDVARGHRRRLRSWSARGRD